ncbi:hypothetical protein [Atopobacter phocae]|uniref:hypothetical protein n=1 Tax=Atopobacter phocae TaxID=136492 RepID=UPI00046F1FDE|nr:hypothetical protein [Atopobacter phocae]
MTKMIEHIQEICQTYQVEQYIPIQYDPLKQIKSEEIVGIFPCNNQSCLLLVSGEWLWSELSIGVLLNRIFNQIEPFYRQYRQYQSRSYYQPVYDFNHFFFPVDGTKRQQGAWMNFSLLKGVQMRPHSVVCFFGEGIVWPIKPTIYRKLMTSPASKLLFQTSLPTWQPANYYRLYGVVA